MTAKDKSETITFYVFSTNLRLSKVFKSGVKKNQKREIYMSSLYFWEKKNSFPHGRAKGEKLRN
jgi:hypothetical protein